MDGNRRSLSEEDDQQLPPGSPLSSSSSSSFSPTSASAASPPSSSATWRKRVASLYTAATTSTSDDKQPHARTGELLHMLNNAQWRKRVMLRLLVEDNDAAVRLRFLGYVAQYETEPNPVERKRKLSGLRDVFLSAKAPCRLEDVPAALHCDVARAKQFIINRLIDHHLVLVLASEVQRADSHEGEEDAEDEI